MLLSVIIESTISCFSMTFRAPHCLGGYTELLPFVILWIQSKRLWTGWLHSEYKGQTRAPQRTWREDRSKGEATMPSSRYCSSYPRNLLLPLSFSWFVPLAVGPCPWLFLIGFHKSIILRSRRGRVLHFQLSVGVAISYSVKPPQPGNLGGPVMRSIAIILIRDRGQGW